jgi:hypothetical protein
MAKKTARGTGGDWRLLENVQAEKLDPQPQVDCALGFLMTNCAPSRPSW